MPMTAPRIGPHIRSQPIGGPACRMTRSPRSGSACAAGITSIRTGSPARMRRNASWLAWSMAFKDFSYFCALALELAEKRRESGIPARGRAPLHMLDRNPLAGQIRREHLEPDVDHAR